MEKVYIYALIDPITKQIRYVGKSINPYKRLYSHLTEKRTTRKCRWIQHLMLSEEIPIVSILEECDSTEWEIRESFWINKLLNENIDLTNLTSGGDGVHNLSQESRDKLSVIVKKRMNDSEFKKRIFTKERAEKISKALTGKTHSKEHISKLPQNQKGYVRNLSEETLLLLAKQSKGNQRAKGLVHTEETKRIIGKANKGRKTNLGKNLSEEHKRKIGESGKGKKRTEEHKKRISKAKKLYWQKIKLKNKIEEEVYELSE